MRLPGYTAGVALEVTGNSFYANGGPPRADGGVRAAIIPRTCMARCLLSMGDDDFAYQNCRCVCFGHPGKTCFLQ